MARRQATASPPWAVVRRATSRTYASFPDGSRVAFVWDEDLDEQFHLFVGDDNRHEVAFTSVTRDVEEAVGTVDLEVEMTQASIDDVIVTVFDTGAGSAQSTDYVFPSDPEVTIPAGQTTGVVVLGIVDDNEEETDETLVLVSRPIPQVMSVTSRRRPSGSWTTTKLARTRSSPTDSNPEAPPPGESASGVGVRKRTPMLKFYSIS